MIKPDGIKIMTEPNNLLGALETTKQIDGDFEYWSARDLMPALGYTTWESFKTAISRAQETCLQTDQSVTDHFRDATKMVLIGSSTQRRIENYF